MPSAKCKSAASSTTQPQQQRQRAEESTANPGARPTSSPKPSTASTGPSLLRAPKVTGKYMVKVFNHIIVSVPSYKDKWFTDRDWCSKFSTYWGDLRGHEDLVTKAIPAFNREMAKMHNYGGVDAQRKYSEKSAHGVFSNLYEFMEEGNTKTTKMNCYLFTDKDSKCPLPPPPIGFKHLKLSSRYTSRKPISDKGCGHSVK